LRSGSAHCGLELAVEVRQCTPRSAARSCDPRLPKETEEEGRKEGKRKEKATVIKSRDPHLAAGERKTEQQKSREAKQTKKHKRTETKKQISENNKQAQKKIKQRSKKEQKQKKAKQKSSEEKK